MATVAGSERFEVRRAELWRALVDPELFGSAVASVDELTVESESRLSAVVRPATGLGALPVAMRFEIVRQAELESAEIRGHGSSAGGEVKLDARVGLRDAAAGTELEWTVEAAVYGNLRPMTQRVLPALIEVEAKRFFAAVAARAAGDGG